MNLNMKKTITLLLIAAIVTVLVSTSASAMLPRTRVTCYIDVVGTFTLGDVVYLNIETTCVSGGRILDTDVFENDEWCRWDECIPCDFQEGNENTGRACTIMIYNIG